MHLLSSFARKAGIIAIVLGLASPAWSAFDLHSADWAKVLKENVTLKGATSEVSYSKLKEHPAELYAFIKAGEALPKTEFEAWPTPEKVAFLLNFYNALTFKLVIENLPLKSFKDIGGLFANPWKRKDVFTLFGEKMSLDLMEQTYLLKITEDPRVHFALTKSARGGPRLGNEPFSAALLDKQLEAAADLFVKDRTRNGYEPKSNTFEVSSLFKWHRDDFIKGAGSTQKFLAARMKIEPPLTEEAIAKAKIKFLDFDWKLNGN